MTGVTTSPTTATSTPTSGPSTICAPWSTEAGRRGIRILLDLVPNHTSDQHPWFVDARRGRDAVHRDWYVWADPAPGGGPPNNWVSVFGGSAWEFDQASGQYFLHNFEREQPDLNWWSDDVRTAFDDIVRYWWDRGIAGFRIDVCNMMIKDAELRDNPPATGDDPLDQQFMGVKAVYNTDRPEAHDILRRWRAIADGYEPPRLLIGETNVDTLATLMDFYGDGHDELHGGFNFVFLQRRARGRRHAGRRRRGGGDPARRGLADLDGLEPRRLPPGHQVGGRRPGQGALRTLILLTLRGTPFLYQGDEIGLTDGPIEQSDLRDSGRHPLLAVLQGT